MDKYKHLMKQKKIVGIFVIIAVILIISLQFIYTDYIQPAMKERTRYVSASIHNEAIKLKENITLKQEMMMVSDTIEGISLAFDNYEGKSTNVVNIELAEAKTQNIIYSWIFDTATGNDDIYSTFYTDSPIKVVKGEKYYLTVTSQEQGINPASIHKANYDISGGKLYQGNTHTDGSIAYEILGGLESSAKYVFIVIALGSILLVVVAGVLILKRPEMEWIFAGIALLLGILYMFIIPPYAVPDEEAHFTTVYAYSSELLGKKVMDKENSVIGRGEELTYYMRTIMPTRDTYSKYLKGILGYTNTKSNGEVTMRAPLDATALGYVPQIAGVTIARILHLNGDQLLFLGRFFGLLFYVTIVFWAIKYMPFAKIMLFLIAILPMSMQQAMSYSYDVTVNAVAFLMIAYFMYLIYEKPRIEKRDIIILTILTLILSPVKVVYVLIIGLGILIPYEKFGKKCYKWISAGLLFLSGMISILYMQFAKLTELAGGRTLPYGDEKGFTLEYLLEAPQNLIGIFLRTSERMTSFYIDSMVGFKLGWLDIQLPNIVIITFIILLFISVLRVENENINYRKYDRLWFGGISLAIISVTCFALLISWTRISSFVIEGVQGRYFLPILPLVLLLFRNSGVYIKKNYNNYLIIAAVSLHLIAILSVFSTVMRR